MLVRRLLDGETGHARRPGLPDARGPVRAAAGPGPAADHDRRVGEEEDAADAWPRTRDQWNSMGERRQARRARRDPARALRGGRAGRAEIERTTTVDIVIRDTHEAGLAYYKARLAANGEEFDPDWNFFVGPPAEIAEGLQPILELGFRHVLVDMPAPYDTRDDRPDRRARRAAERVTAPSVVALAGGVGRREAGRRPRRPPGRSAVGRRQHRATTASGTACSSCPTTTPSCTTSPGSSRSSGAGASRATPTRRWRSWSSTARRAGSRWATATSRCTSPGRRACGPAGG